jgi:hypothetical protein
MSKLSKKKELDATKTIMARLAAMPHKPHVPKKKAAKKKPIK